MKVEGEWGEKLVVLVESLELLYLEVWVLAQRSFLFVAFQGNTFRGISRKNNFSVARI
jgi:hypothetical protein